MLFKSTNFLWPFTLNYLFNKTDCINCDENSDQTIEGLWQFPLHQWTYPNCNLSFFFFLNLLINNSNIIFFSF